MINNSFVKIISGMIVYKFGGASVKDAAGIKNLSELVSKENANIVIVVSAFGKTTNGLERVLKAWHSGDVMWRMELNEIRNYHFGAVEQLFNKNDEVNAVLSKSFDSLEADLSSMQPGDFDHDYDMVVSMGEVWSTIVVEAYLRSLNFNSK